jgi:hypothetical protein
MLYHWNMIQSHDKQNHRESMLMPLFFTFYDNYLLSSKSFQLGLNWIEDVKNCHKPTKYGQLMFCEAVKVDMANSKEASLSNTISREQRKHTILIFNFEIFQQEAKINFT